MSVQAVNCNIKSNVMYMFQRSVHHLIVFSGSCFKTGYIDKLDKYVDNVCQKHALQNKEIQNPKYVLHTKCTEYEQTQQKVGVETSNCSGSDNNISGETGSLCPQNDHNQFAQKLSGAGSDFFPLPMCTTLLISSYFCLISAIQQTT